MKINLHKNLLCFLRFASLLLVAGPIPAGTQVLPSSRNSAVISDAALVLARPQPTPDVDGSILSLPDGSAIMTTFPAALELSTMPGNSSWVDRPIRPRCEPAVYSLTRVMPDGKELWAKSYIFKGRVTEVCLAEYFGFSVRSAISEVEKPGFYRSPFDGRFFVSDPEKFEVDAATGDVFGDVPKNLRVIDAHELRALKERIEKEIEGELPQPFTNKGKMNEQVYKTQLFKRLEKALFPDVPHRGASKQRS